MQVSPVHAFDQRKKEMLVLNFKLSTTEENNYREQSELAVCNKQMWLTRLCRFEYRVLGCQHSFVNEPLFVGELSVGRIRTCDVRCIAIVLCTHIQ